VAKNADRRIHSKHRQLASLVDQIINPPPKAKVDQLDEHRRKRRRV
jgi:hypothetical protein